MQAREKVGKSRNTVFLPMVCCSGGSKSRMRDEKLHAVVARSTFGSQNVQNSPGSDHFWKLRCRKSARRCGGPLLEVEMMKKCTALWREAHFEVKMCKTPQLRSTFGSWDVEKVDAVVARNTFRGQNVKNTTCLDHFWTFRCRFAWQAQGIVHLVKVSKTWGFCSMSKTLHVRATFAGSDVEKVHAVVARSTFRSQNIKKKNEGFGPLLEVQMSLRVTTLHCTTLHSTTLHYTTLHYTTLHYNYTTTFHYTPLHSTTLNHTTLHYPTLPYTTLHYTTLPSTTLHYTPLHYTTWHYTTLHSTTLRYTTLHYTTLHYTESHCTTGRQVDR